MMNLEVLFVGEALTGNQTFRKIAISHADKTMQNHIRADGVSYSCLVSPYFVLKSFICFAVGSSFHLVQYNSTTGAVISRGTVQGYSDSR